MVFTVTPTLTLQKVLNEHSAVFKEGLGELHGIAAQILIKGDVTINLPESTTSPVCYTQES